MVENKKRINAIIPIDLYSQVTQLDYSITDAVVKGLELLLAHEIVNPKIINVLNARIEYLQKEIDIKNTQIGKLTDTMQAQAVQVQTMIQQKAIEAPGAKKPW